MTDRRGFLAGGLAVISGCGRGRQASSSGYAFVANQGGKAVAVVDLSAFAVVRHVPLPDAPHQLLASASRPVVYALTPDSGAVHEIDVTTLNPGRRLRIGARASQMMPASGGRGLWVLGHGPEQLVHIEPESFSVDARVPAPAPAANFDLAPALPRAALALAGTDEVCQAALDGGGCQPPVRLREAVRAVRYRKDGKVLLAAHAAERLLTAVDAASSRVVVRLPLAVRPDNLCFKADGGQLFVTGEGLDAVAIVFPYLTEVAETILAGNAPGAMAASHASASDPEYLFVTNPRAGQVTIINIATRKVLAVAPTGADPGAVIITPDNRFALVLNRRSGDIAVLLIQSAARRRRFPAALFTMIPVGSSPVSAVIRGV